MIWKKDKLKPTQPYFVFDTNSFYQEVYLRQGISHFYTFNIAEGKPMRIVPDGCIDLFFEYYGGKMKGYVCGTTLKYTCRNSNTQGEVFGVRFMPGIQPELLIVTMRELLNDRIDIDSAVKGDRQWFENLENESDFYQRIRIFLEHYTKAERKREKPYGKKELLYSVKQLVYESDGKIKVSEMQNMTGYSERYINKVFIEEMGFSPKTFCKIIQFQRALEFLNYGAPDKMADAAVYLGYYDQPQFIRDFEKYAGITPKRYLKLAAESGYKNSIRQTDFFS